MLDMSSDDAAGGATASAGARDKDDFSYAGKELYTYKASWQTHSLGFSNRHHAPRHDFRVAVGSYIEDYANRIHVRASRESRPSRLGSAK